VPRSIVGWFVVCWSAFLLAAVVAGALLWSLYQQSTTEQLRRAAAAVAHGCDAVAAAEKMLSRCVPKGAGGPSRLFGLTVRL
jgi:hypothetical protein